MNLRAFYRKYGLELIPVAQKTLTFGKCIWDGGWFDKPSFNHDGMPNYIYNTFVEKNIITIDECEEQLERFRAIEKVDAEFATINIEFDIEETLSLDIAKKIEADGGFDMQKIKSFSISGSVGKAMPNRDRIALDRMLDQIKDNHWDEYRSTLRRAYIITELYYGKVEITIDTDLELEFEAAVPNSDLQVANKFKYGRNISYVFESSQVPFAMRLERVKHFNS